MLDVETIINYVKCKPYRSVSSNRIGSLSQLLDLWLPPILPKIIKDDFIEFFARKISGQLGWLRSSLDSSFSSFKIEFELGGYRGLPDFVFWDDNLDGRFLERIIPLLHAIADCSNNPLTAEQFVTLATDLCQWANFPLSSLDVSIITSLCQMPTISIPALARLLHTPYKKTRSRWKRLQRLNIIRMTAIPCYQCLGLQGVIIELHDTHRKLMSPYLLSRVELTGEGNQVLYNMVVPEEYLGSLARFLRRELGAAHSLYLLKDKGHSISFAHYQLKRCRWNIDWRKMFIGAHLLHRNEEKRKYRDFFESEQTTPRPYVLCDKDKRLIPVLISDARIKLERLAKTVNMSLSQVSRRKSKLIELEVLRLRPLLRRTGLIEDIVIKVSEQDPRLLGIVEELPQTWIKQLTDLNSGEKQLLISATLPAGSFAMMRYYLRRYLQSKSEIYLSGPESGGWPLSFETYDVKNGCWIWQEPRLAEEKNESVFSQRDPSSKLDQRIIAE